MVNLSIYIHIVVVIFLILSQLTFFVIKNEENFIIFSKKFRFLQLIQNIIFGMIVFTGIIVMAVTKFTLWNIEIFFMIFLALIILSYQIILYKKNKPIKSTEKELQNSFKNYVSKIYLNIIIAEIILFMFARAID